MPTGNRAASSPISTDLVTPHQAFKELESVAMAYANGAEEKKVKRIAEALSILRLVVGPRRKRSGVTAAETPKAVELDAAQPHQPNLL